MLELIMIVTLVLVMVTCVYLPDGCSMLFFKSTPQVNTGEKTPLSTTLSKAIVPEDSMLRRHFLTQVQSEIEAALFPRPTDSVLQRHYDSLVAVELSNRLHNYR